MPRMTSAVPVLTAKDVAADHAFWVGVLGFTGTMAGTGFARLARDDVQMFICSVDDQVVPDNTQAWIRVQDLDELHDSWAARVSTDFADTSGPAVTEIAQMPWGREFAVRDPAGNCVHFSERQ